MKGTTKAVLIAGLLVLLLPAYAQRSERAKRIGDRLWCMCGCNQILTQCNHVGCSTSTAMLKKLDVLDQRGDSDDLILQAFVQEYGTQVQSQPPAKGFTLMGYVLPGVALLAGLAIVLVYIQHWRRVGLQPAEAGHPKISAEMLDRARQQAERDTDLDAEFGTRGGR